MRFSSGRPGSAAASAGASGWATVGATSERLAAAAGMDCGNGCPEVGIRGACRGLAWLDGFLVRHGSAFLALGGTRR